MLGKLDALVQRYISAASNRGSVITRSVVTYTLRALLYSNQGYFLGKKSSANRYGTPYENNIKTPHSRRSY